MALRGRPTERRGRGHDYKGAKEAVLNNARWERFCQLYARDGNASAAYRGAGYQPKTDASACNSASRLLGIDEVRNRVQELTQQAREQAERSSIADIVEIRQRITQILRGQTDLETKAADVIKAGDFLARVGGQVETPAVKVELSLDDKWARLQELLHADD